MCITASTASSGTSNAAAEQMIIGRPFRSDSVGHTLLSKRIALPIFASDPLSSVAYATQEILLVLTLGGLSYLYLTWWIGAAVVLLLAVVVLSYRQVVQAYPSGGGSYEVVSRNLGPRAGLVVAAALLVDYVMTVSVSVAAGVDNIISAIPHHRVLVNVAFIALLAAVNLRGVRESGRAFAVPTYGFIVGVMAMHAIGLARWLLVNAPQAENAAWGVNAEHVGLNTLALSLLALRAFSSGCTALTGVEAISNGVPAFRKPKALNAARTMTAMGVLAITMFAGVTAVALITHTRIAISALRIQSLTIWIMLGIEDALDIVLDTDNPLMAPARKLAMKLLNVEPPPIVRGIGLTPIPRPERLLFWFGEPISTLEYGGVADEHNARELRGRTAASIEGGLDFLFDEREKDPHRPLLRRLIGSDSE